MESALGRHDELPQSLAGGELGESERPAHRANRAVESQLAAFARGETRYTGRR